VSDLLEQLITNSDFDPRVWHVSIDWALKGFCSSNSFFVQALRDHTGLYPIDDKSEPPLICYNESDHSVRTFLSILCSGTPGAINQLVVTQLYNPAGSAHTLAMFLAVQCKFSRLDRDDNSSRQIYLCRFCLRKLCYSTREWFIDYPSALAAIALYIVT